MENNNWRPTQGEFNMDGVDWRTQLPPDSRQRIVNKIMDTLKRLLPISGAEGILELKKIVVQFEEKIYSAATSQTDYLQRISLKMLSMETKLQNSGVPDSLPSNFVVSNQKPPDSAPYGMQSQVPNQGQLPIPLPNQALAWPHLLSLNIQNAGVESTMQNDVGQSSNLQYLHQQQQEQLQLEILKQKFLQGNILQPSLLQQSKPSDSTAQTNHANAGDWQEEVYQKIKSMKEMYLPDLTEMHQKITLKCQQIDSLPQPSKEQIEKLKMMKIMLERVISFLQLPKNNIPPGFREKLGQYEKQLVTFLNTHRPRKIIPSQLHASGGHPLSMQQQQSQQQSQISLTQHDNQMNPQMLPMNLQNSVATNMQSTAATDMQHGSMPPLATHLGVPNTQSNMMSSMQLSSMLESGQARQSSLQQNTVSAPQQANIMLSQRGLSGLQSNTNPTQLNSNMHRKTTLVNMMNSLKPSLTLESGQAPTSMHQGGGVGSLKQNTVSAPQQANINFSQCFQPDVNPIQVNSNVLQHQSLKQPLLQSQETKQMPSYIPLAPSPILVDPEKQAVSNAGNVEQSKKKSFAQAPSPFMLFLFFFGIVAWRFLCCGDA